MKKFLSILLAVAMVISVVSVVTFAADDFKQIIKYDFEDEKAPDGSQGKSPAFTYETDDSHGKVFRFTTGYGWESPYFELGAAIKKAIADNGIENGVVKVSFDAKTVADDGAARVIVRNVMNRVSDKEVSVEGSTNPEHHIIPGDFEGNKNGTAFSADWETYEFEFPMTAADAEKINEEDGDKYRFMFDLMKGKELGMYLDNLVVSVKDAKAADVKTPTGVTFTVKEDLDLKSDEAQFICSPKLIITDKDVKDNKLTKTLLIKNNGEEDITLMFRIQAQVKGADGNDTWAGNPNDKNPVVIEPGQTKSITFTSDASNGNVTILDQQVPLKDLFIRFDLYHLDGDFAVSAGTSFTVFCDADTANVLAKTVQMANKDKFGIELCYETNGKPNGTGDVLPVALITVAVASIIALVVVSKKKRQEI